MIGMVTRLVEAKGLDLVTRILDELLEYENVQFVILGTGDRQYEDWFKGLVWRYPKKVSANIFFNNELAHQIYAASDLFLMPSQYEPCGIGQLIALRYGTVPIVRATGGLKILLKHITITLKLVMALALITTMHMNYYSPSNVQ